MGFLEVMAYLNLSLIDLIIFELLLLTIFFVDSAGNIKFTLDYLFGISKSKATGPYVTIYLTLGITYFFTSNYFQDTIVKFLVDYFGYFLIGTFLILLFFDIFWISKMVVGRKIEFKLCWIPLLISGGLTLLLIVVLGLIK